MRCIVCQRFSYPLFCHLCIPLLKPSIHLRKIGEIDVISLYSYQDIKELLTTKHSPLGYRVYKSLANLSLKPFMDYYIKDAFVYIVGIDEYVFKGYSHIALLTQKLKNKNRVILHAKLMAKNRVTYSGQSLAFRKDNPRNFIYNGKKDIDVVLVDDIITSGTTIKEAIEVLKANRVEVLFVLTLADASY